MLISVFDMTLSIKMPISKIINYYNRSSKIINPSSLTPTYIRYLKAEETFLKKTIPNGVRILEIGAGHGRIIDSLNNGKREVIGIEIANTLSLKNKYKMIEISGY